VYKRAKVLSVIVDDDCWKRKHQIVMGKKLQLNASYKLLRADFFFFEKGGNIYFVRFRAVNEHAFAKQKLPCVCPQGKYASQLFNPSFYLPIPHEKNTGFDVIGNHHRKKRRCPKYKRFTLFIT